MRRYSVFCFLLGLWGLVHCSDGGAGGPVTLRGGVQKGPFVLGSTVQVAMLDGQGNPTGQVFNTTTKNDLGEFDVTLAAPGNAKLSGTGFYFNELLGKLSGANITLHALANVSASGTQQAYINVITHMAQRRANRLLASGTAFAQVIAQAETELRSALGIIYPSQSPGAAIGMSLVGGDTPDNQYLLGVSCILAKAAELTGPDAQDAKLQELINTIAIDLEADGTLEASVVATLIDAEKAVDSASCKKNLQDWLTQKGSSATPPDLDKVIDSDKDGVANGNESCRLEALASTGTPTGEATAIAVHGTRAYVGGTQTVRFYDVSDSSKPPQETNFISGNNLETVRLRVSGNTAFVGGSTGLRTLDVSSAKWLGALQWAQPPTEMQLAGNTLVVTSTNATQVIGVANPAAPQVLATLGTGATALALEGSAGYLSDGTTVRKLDIGDPSQPQLGPPSANLPHSVSALGQLGTFVYAVGGTAAGGGLTVVDGSASPPLVLGTWSDPVEASHVVVHGSFAYVAVGREITVIDVSDSTAPTYATKRLVSTSDAVRDMTVEGDVLYVVTGSAIHTFAVGCSSPGDGGPGDGGPGDGGPGDGGPDVAADGGSYPPGPYGTTVGSVVEDLSFSGYADAQYLCKPPVAMVADTATVRTLSFGDFFRGDASCSAPAKALLWIVVHNGWDGVSDAETKTLQSDYAGGSLDPRVAVLSIVPEDVNLAPASTGFVKTWIANKSLSYPVVADPTHKMSKFASIASTPYHMLVDLRNMTIVFRQSGANYPNVKQQIASFVASLPPVADGGADASTLDASVDTTVDVLKTPPDSTIDAIDAGVPPDASVDSLPPDTTPPDTTADITPPDSTVDSTVDTLAPDTSVDVSVDST